MFKRNHERVVCLSDFHAPFHDNKAVLNTLSFIKWFKPDKLYILGDLVDFYALSRFEKDPKRENELQKELDAAIGILTDLRNVSKKADITFKAGNHCSRLERWKKGNKTTEVRALDIRNLLELSKNDISYVNEYDELYYKDIQLTHGHLIRKFSGYTAKALWEDLLISSGCGHSHRLGHYFTTKAGKVYQSFENGCLCSLKPEYNPNPDWQQGFSTIIHYDNGISETHQHLVNNGAITFFGKVFQ